MRERAQEDAAIETEPQESLQTEQEETPRTRFVGAEGGEIPPVQVAEQEDARVVELKTKVGKLVTKRFEGDYHKAFDKYDADHDGNMTRDEIIELLDDAGVGNGLTRGMWANGILDKLDMNHDRGVSWSEFESVFRGSARA